MKLEARLITSDLAENGYIRFQGYEEDSAVCAKAECESCGRVGMRYEAYKTALKSYLAFAVCPACGFRTEF